MTPFDLTPNDTFNRDLAEHLADTCVIQPDGSWSTPGVLKGEEYARQMKHVVQTVVIADGRRINLLVWA